MAFGALIGSLRVALRLDQAEYVEGLKQSKAELRKTAFELNKIAREAGSVGRAFTVGLTVPLAAAGAATVKTAANFESSMIKVKISTQATKGEIASLETEARKIGKATTFSAGQAADAMDMLAKTGLTTSQILGGAAKAAVNLAAAAGSELEPAASAVSDAMQQFGLSAAQLPGVVDQITGAVNESKLSFEDFVQASGQAGGVASSLGVSFEDFNAVLAGTSPLFASGSDAGTSFKTFLTTLVPKSEEAAAAISQFGLKFFEADGSLRSMSAIAEELRTKLAGLSDEAKNQVLKDIFGTDAMRTAIGLMNQGAAGLDLLKKKIAETDAAAQAAERMKGFTGQLDQLKGSLEELAIAVGKAGVLSAATQLVQSLSSVIDKVSELDPLVVKMSLGFGAGLAAIGPLNLGIAALAAGSAKALRAIAGLATGATTLRAAMTGIGAFLGPGGLLVLGIGAVAAVSILAVKRFREQRAASAEVTRQSDALTSATHAYVSAARAAIAASGEARTKALQEAAATRELALQKRDAAAAQLKLAHATLAAAEAALAKRVNETNPFLVNAEDPNSGLVAQDSRVARARANLDTLRGALTRANADIAAADRVIAAGSQQAAAGVAKLNTKLAEKSEAASKAAKALADAKEELRDYVKAQQEELNTRGLDERQLKIRELQAKATEALRLGLEAEFQAILKLIDAYRDLGVEVEKVDASSVDFVRTIEDFKPPRGLTQLEQLAQDLADSFDNVRYSFEGILRSFKTGDFSRLTQDVLSLVRDIPALLAQGPAGIATLGSALANGIGGRAGRAIGGGLGLAASGLGAGAFAGTTAGAAALGTLGLSAGAIASIASLAGPIGLAAGALYAAVKLFNIGGKPSNKGAGFDLVTGQISGNKRDAETEQAARGAGEAILGIQKGLKDAGIVLNDAVRGLVIGTRDQTQIYLQSGRELRSAVGDGAAAVDTAFRALLETATFSDDIQKTLVQGLVAAGKGFEEISAALDKLATTRGLRDAVSNEILRLTDAEAFDVKQLEDAQKARRAEFKSALDSGFLSQSEFDALQTKLAQLEDLELKEVLSRYADEVVEATRDFRKEIGDDILRLADPRAFQLTELRRTQEQRRKDLADAFAAGLLSQAELDQLQADVGRLEDLELADLMKAFADEAEEAARALTQAREDILAEYFQALGDDAATRDLARRRELESLPEELRPLKRALFDVQDEVAARDAAKAKADEARANAVRAAEEETRRLEGMRDRFKSLAQNIAAVARELTSGSLAQLDSRQRALITAGELGRLQRRAATGDEDALARLPDAIRAFVDAQGAVAGSRSQLNAQLLLARRAASVGEKAALSQVSDAERQLEQLKVQIAHLTQATAATQSMDQALRDYAAKDLAFQASQQSLTQATNAFLATLPAELRSVAEQVGSAVAAAPPPNLAPVDAGAITRALATGPEPAAKEGGGVSQAVVEALQPILGTLTATQRQMLGLWDDVTQGGTELRTVVIP